MQTPQPSPAFLSVRLPKATRDRLKTAAAARGETMQELVGGLVQRYLAEEDRKAPALGTVMSRLRAHAPALKVRGMTGLWVFGSVARGDAHLGSDVDLFAEFGPDARLSLVGLASLRAELSELLDAPADLVERGVLHRAARKAAERDGVRVL